MSARRTTPPGMIAGPTGHEDGPGAPAPDPRAVRVGVAPSTRLDGDPAFTVGPAPESAAHLGHEPAAPSSDPLVDGIATSIRLRRIDDSRAVLHETVDGRETRTAVLFGAVRLDRERGADVREVVVGGWRIEVEVEPERRAVLRERARRGAGAASHGGPVEVRAIIPGRIVEVAIVAGDPVEAGQQILVVEAMKMQNELRAPREGIVERVGVAVGDTIEVGDLLVVIR